MKEKSCHVHTLNGQNKVKLYFCCVVLPLHQLLAVRYLVFSTILFLRTTPSLRNLHDLMVIPGIRLSRVPQWNWRRPLNCNQTQLLVYNNLQSIHRQPVTPVTTKPPSRLFTAYRIAKFSSIDRNGYPSILSSFQKFLLGIKGGRRLVRLKS